MAIADPSSDRKDAFIMKNVKNGEWEAHVVMGQSLGDRVPVKFSVFHMDFLNNHGVGPFVPANKRINVDTAQVIMIDGDKYPEQVGEYEDVDSFYSQACMACFNDTVVDEAGFVCSSANFDGSFSLKKIVNDDKIVGLSINFLE
jgi:hypothetical protein